MNLQMVQVKEKEQNDIILIITENYVSVRKDNLLFVEFYHPDHLGSTALITDENGSVVEETNFKPFGGKK